MATKKPTKTVMKKPAKKAPAKKPAPRAADPFRGKRYAFFGELAVWPSYHAGSPADVAQRRGATIVYAVADATTVVFGDLRGTGRAEAKKAAGKLAHLEILDEAAYRERVRIDLAGKRFAFIGGFDCSPAGLDDGLLARMVERAGATVTADIDAALDYLVVGNRRGPQKIALHNKAKKLIEAGAPIAALDETAFLELVRVEKPPAADGALDFAGFLSQLYGNVEEKKLGRALDMLRKDRFQLYAKLDDERLLGVVQSQSSAGSVYATWLTSEGHYGCAQTSLEECMGLQGSVCKHLLVLVVGLTRTQQLPLARALTWMRSAGAKGPRADVALCAETFVQYKGATAGEVDWRPTETIPEDFYAL